MIVSNMDGAHIIEVNDLVISMRTARNEEKAKFPLLQKARLMPCDVYNDVYQPSVVSIGPYHHKAVATLETEQRKWESLSYVLRLNPAKKMRDYRETVFGLEQQIRSCYASDIKIDSDDFIKMVLLDGCFLLCTLYGTEGAAQPVSAIDTSSKDESNLICKVDFHDSATSIEVGDSQQNTGNYTYNDNGLGSIYYSKYWYTAVSTQDLVLLENQIPFFVVVKLFEVVCNRNIPNTVLLENASRFMKDLLLSYPEASFRFDRPKTFHHLLDLCHQYFKPNKIGARSKSYVSTYDDDGVQNAKLLGWRRTLEYCEVGVEFKKRESCSENPHSLLDIVFWDGIMEIPYLTIDPNTYCLFRNFIAFEETCPQFGNYVTSYVVFLSQLVSMPEDVSLLVKAGIIVHHLDGDVEVAGLFKMLAEGVNFDINSDHYLERICHEMEAHYQMQRPRWRERLGSIGLKFPSGPHDRKPNQLCTGPSHEECV